MNKYFKPKKKTKPANWMSVRGAQPVRHFKKERVKKTWHSKFERKPKVKKTKTARQLEKAEDKKLYKIEAKEYVLAAIERGEVCPVAVYLNENKLMPFQVDEQLFCVHHKRGRRGKLLRDQRHWMAISFTGHEWVHNNMEEARKHGWLCEAGKWDVYEE